MIHFHVIDLYDLNYYKPQLSIILQLKFKSLQNLIVFHPTSN